MEELRTGRVGRRVLFAGVILAALAWVLFRPATPPVMAPAATVAGGDGYWLVGTDGALFNFGAAPNLGSTASVALNRPVLGMAARPDGKGYWFVASDGGIFNFGSAPLLGSMGGTPLNKPVVGIAASPSGNGYWMVATDGGIFNFGDAGFFGSTGNIKLNKPIVAMAAAPDGKGYWFVASDGGIFNFGSAGFFGSMGGSPLNKPIVGMAATPSGKGYWLVASDGGIFSFGDATFFGSTGAIVLNRPIVGMAANPDGKGYWFVATDGGIFNFGSAKFFGSAGGSSLTKPIIGMASMPLRVVGNAVPVVGVTSGPSDGSATNVVTPSYGGTASDSDGLVSTIEVSVDGGGFGTAGVTCLGCGTGSATWSFAPSSPLTAGAHSVAFRSVDSDAATSVVVSRSVTVDLTPPTVIINQAAGQADPVRLGPVTFSVAFSEPVTGFTGADVNISGTAGGSKTASVSGGPSTYTVSVTGMTTSGTVVASVPSGGAVDAAGNTNTGSTSTDNAVTWDVTAPTVTINQAAAQTDPTSASPINFTVVFSESVTGFATGDVSLSGTAGATTASVTGSGTTYNVAVSGMTAPGTVIASVPAGVAADAAGNTNAASTATDNTVNFDNAGPTVTINQAAAQTDPTNGSPINFTVVFSKTVTGFVTGDVALSGTAGATTGTVTGSGTTYNVAVSGMTSDGTVIASIAAGVATDGVGNPNLASTSTDNTVTRDTVAPTVTINQAAGQADPTNGSTINFTVVFSESTTTFATGDVSLSGTAGATTATVTGSGTTYNVAVTGMTGDGTVIATVAAGVATDAAANTNLASTSTDNTVARDVTRPSVTINQAAGQADPTNGSTINFTVVFSESTTTFATGDVSLSGTAGATTATVTGSGTTYNVAVTGMTTDGTVIATVAAGVATDAASNTNTASTSTDNTVTRDTTRPTVTINQAAGQADPTNGSTVNFTVVFSESTTTFATGDVSLSGTAGATTGTVTGSGTTYNVAVTGMTTDGTVIATVAAGVATDAAGNTNLASTSTDNTVTRDTVAPTVTINQAAGQADPTNGSTINFTVVFSESTSTFATGDVSLSGTAGATTGTVTGSGTTYNVAVTGMTTDGTVIATVAAGAATDAASNTNTASTSTDNTVTRDVTAPTVTINQSAGQLDPTNGSTINFTVVFSESTATFATGDVSLSGTAGATTGTVTGSGTTYNVAVTGMTVEGTVIASISAGLATDAAGNTNAASTSTDNTVSWDKAPTVTIDQASGQADPTNGTITFHVVFSEVVTGFATGDVSLSGTAGATTGTVSGSGSVYDVAVTGMTGDGTVIATVPPGVAQDAFPQDNLASTSTDNSVTYDQTAPTLVSIAPNGSDGSVVATFSEALDCTTVVKGDFDVNSTTPNPATCLGATVTLGTSFTFTGGETVTLTIVGSVSDPAGNATTSGSVANDVPALALSTGPANESTVTSATYTGTAGDASLTAVEVKVGAGDFSTLGVSGTTSWTYAPTLADGTYTLTFRSRDSAGGTSPTITRTVTIDTTGPVFLSVTSTTGSTSVTVTFNEPVDCATVATTDFTAQVHNSPVNVTGAACTGSSDSTIVLTISAAPTGGNKVSVTVAAGAVADVLGNLTAGGTQSG